MKRSLSPPSAARGEHRPGGTQRLSLAGNLIRTVIGVPEYIVMSRLTAEGRKTLRTNPDRLLEVNEEIDKMGAKVMRQYALLGKYDFLTILEAPNNETMAKVMVELGARGSLETVTFAAMRVEDLLSSLK